MELDRILSKHYVPCLCDDVLGAIANDGLVYLFEQRDIQQFLDQYPRDRGGWYFNSSRDRYIAEHSRDGLISVNPQFVIRHFKEQLD